MGGGGSKTTTQTNEPWAPQQPYLTDQFSLAKGLYESNPQNASARQAISLYQGYPTSSEYSTGMGILNNVARGDNVDSFNLGNVNTLSQYGGLTTQGKQAQYVLSGLAQNGAIDANGYSSLSGIAANGVDDSAARTALASIFSGSNLDSQGMDYLRRVTSGDYLTDQNPYFNDMVNNSIAAARPSVDAAFASSGRLGSGSHAAALADSANRTATTLGYQDYQAERQLQDQAARGLLTYGLQDASTRADAASRDAGIAATDANVRLNAGQGLLNAGFQDASTRSGAATGLLNSDQADAALKLNAAKTGLDYNTSMTASKAAAAQQLIQLGLTPAQAMAAAAILEDQTGEYARLKRYADLIGGNYGGTATSTGPGTDNTGAYVGAAGSIAAASAIAI